MGYCTWRRGSSYWSTCLLVLCKRLSILCCSKLTPVPRVMTVLFRIIFTRQLHTTWQFLGYLLVKLFLSISKRLHHQLSQLAIHIRDFPIYIICQEVNSILSHSVEWEWNCKYLEEKIHSLEGTRGHWQAKGVSTLALNAIWSGKWHVVAQAKHTYMECCYYYCYLHIYFFLWNTFLLIHTLCLADLTSKEGCSIASSPKNALVHVVRQAAKSFVWLCVWERDEAEGNRISNTNLLYLHER